MHCLDGSQRPPDAVNSLTICFSAGKIYLPQSCRPRRQPSPDFQMAVIRNSHALSLGRRYLLIYSHLMPTFYRVAGASFLATGWMMAAAVPLIDLVYRRGRFLVSDTQTTAVYFFWFSLSLAFWSAQGLYARAFYAAGDTLTPMLAVTVITGASLPIYSLLFHRYGVVGLAFASDIGIGANLLALAWLLHYRKMVSLKTLRWDELGKTALTAIVAGGISLEVAKTVPLPAYGNSSRTADILQLALLSVTWAAATAAGLWLLKSHLPNDLRRRKQIAYPAVAQNGGKEIMDAGTQP